MTFKRRLFIVFIAFFLAFSGIAPEFAQAKTTSSESNSAASKSKAKAGKSAKATAKKQKTTTSAKSGTKKTAKRSAAARKKLAQKLNRRAIAQYAQDKYAALVVDSSTGKVLFEENAGSLRYPASLTKMMTLYLTFDALKAGRISMGDSLPVSVKAASQPQTNISLDPGDRLPVRTAIESLVVRSANDSSMVLAEALGQTEWNFALMMTQKARELGMKNTVFRNPNGLPDPGQYTTAYDMARLGIALRRDFPEYYHFFKLQSFSYNGVTYPGHNRVLNRFDGADGVKTGFIRASGFNLVTSAKKDGMSLVGVVMGGTSAQNRDDRMIALLERSFADLAAQKASVASSSPQSALDDVSTASNTPSIYPEMAPAAGQPSQPEPQGQGGAE